MRHPQPPSTFPIVCPDILLTSLFLSTLTPMKSMFFPQTDQVLHPYNTISNIIVNHISTFKLLERTREDRIFWNEWWQVFHEFNLFWISSWMQLWFVAVVPKHLDCPKFL